MIYKMLPRKEGEPQIYARIDDDGLCRLTCTADYHEFQAWVEAGNTPFPQTITTKEQYYATQKG